MLSLPQNILISNLLLKKIQKDFKGYTFSVKILTVNLWTATGQIPLPKGNKIPIKPSTV